MKVGVFDTVANPLCLCILSLCILCLCILSLCMLSLCMLSLCMLSLCGLCGLCACAGVVPLRQELAAGLSHLSAIERQLAQLESLGDEEDRGALQKRIDLIERAGLSPGGCCADRLWGADVCVC